jgi:MoaA/NifB/PqqE/SkfB family radical SAM enzyme
MKTLCSRPWNNLSISPTGQYRICCISAPHDIEHLNFITDENEKHVLISEKTPTEVFNTKTYIDIRNNFLNNLEPKQCKYCFDVEKNNLVSPRMEYNKKWINEENAFLFTQDVVDIKNIKHLDLRLGNICNLKCRMCNPFTSSQWIDDWNDVAITFKNLGNLRLFGNILSENEKKYLKNNDWISNKKTWKNLYDLLDNLEEISLTGGEPTLAVGLYHLYDMIFAKNLEKKINLKIYTNLTNAPDKMIDYWKKFKKVEITCSIDGYDDVNRYIRYPTNWNAIEKNIKKYAQYENINLRISTTVQMYNILGLEKLLNWIIEKNIFDDIILYTLKEPILLQIAVLPEKLKMIAESRLKPFVNNKYFMRENRCQVDQLIQEMNSLDLSQYLNAFFVYTQILDKKRNEDITKLIPELELYRNAWINYVKNTKKII